jgi:hypothetical protein
MNVNRIECGFQLASLVVRPALSPAERTAKAMNNPPNTIAGKT